MTISIITPSYNQGCFIERTIQSVLAQNNSDELDYIVMDGGSQDETLSILSRYSKHLRYISEKDSGQAHAINKGLAMASGDIIGWLNSDDIYYPSTLKKIQHCFLQYPEIDVIYGKANHIDENDQVIEAYPTESWKIKRLKETCFISQPSVFWRRKLLSRFGLLDESLQYCMDYEYWLRLGLGGARFYYLKEYLAGSRLHPKTKTLSAPLNAAYEAMTMLRQRIKYVPVTWVIHYSVQVLTKAKKQPPASFSIGINVFYTLFYWNGFVGGMKGGFALLKLIINRIRRKLARRDSMSSCNIE